MKKLKSKEQSPIWNLMSCTLAIISILTAVLVVIFESELKNLTRRTKLELVDVTVLPGKDTQAMSTMHLIPTIGADTRIYNNPPYRASIIDFKVRNSGDQAIFLKRASFHIKEYRRVKFCETPSEEPVSYIYDVELPIEPPNMPFITSIDISQSIPPNDVDRFQFSIGVPDQTLDATIYQLYIEILYNAGEKNKIQSGDIVLWIAGQNVAPGYIGGGPNFASCVEQNLVNILYMLRLTGIREKSLYSLKAEAEANQIKSHTSNP